MLIHHDAESVLWIMMKLSYIGNPDIYLEAKMKNMTLENGVWAWMNSPKRYVK